MIIWNNQIFVEDFLSHPKCFRSTVWLHNLSPISKLKRRESKEKVLHLGWSFILSVIYNRLVPKYMLKVKLIKYVLQIFFIWNKTMRGEVVILVDFLFSHFPKSLAHSGLAPVYPTHNISPVCCMCWHLICIYIICIYIISVRYVMHCGMWYVVCSVLWYVVHCEEKLDTYYQSGMLCRALLHCRADTSSVPTSQPHNIRHYVVQYKPIYIYTIYIS